MPNIHFFKSLLFTTNYIVSTSHDVLSRHTHSYSEIPRKQHVALCLKYLAEHNSYLLAKTAAIFVWNVQIPQRSKVLSHKYLIYMIL